MIVCGLGMCVKVQIHVERESEELAIVFEM